MLFGKLYNDFRQYAYNENFIMNNKTVIDYFLECMNIGYDYIMLVEKYEETLENIIDNKQLDEITYLLFDNVCNHVGIFLSIEICEKFESGITKQGLVVLILRYLQNIRLSYQEYQTAKANDDIEYDFFNSNALFNSCK